MIVPGGRTISFFLAVKRKSQPLLLLVAFLFLFFPRNSVGPVPFIDFFAKYAKQWPNAALEPESEYIRDSGLGQIIFRVLPLEGIYSFGILHLAALLCGFVLIYFTLKNELKADYVYPVFRIILLGQIGYVLFRWVGSYDAFTFLLWGLFFFQASYKHFNLALLPAIGLGFQHFEQAILGVLGLLLVSTLLNQEPRIFTIRFLLKTSAGIVFGKFLLLGILLLNGHPVSGRSNYFTLDVVELGFSEVKHNLLYFIWSLFGAIWVVIFNLLLKAPDKLRLVPIILYLTFCITVSIFARDHTRVFVLTTFPILFYSSVVILKNHNGANRYLGRIEILTWVTVPIALWENNLLGGFNLLGEIISKIAK